MVKNPSNFTPFQFEGGLVSGSLTVSSIEEWIDRVVTPYAHKLKSPDLPLQAVMVGNNSKGFPVFTLHRNKGVKLQAWAEGKGVNLVIAI